MRKIMLITVGGIFAVILAMSLIVEPHAEQATEQHWPTISEIQEFCGAEIDGVWGPETDRLYRAAQERWYCDEQYRLLMERQK